MKGRSEMKNILESARGAWKLEARKNIANYLRESLKDSGAIVVE